MVRPSIGVSVRGAEKFEKVSRALKDAGRGDLRKALNAEMRKGARPLIPQARDSALSTLPTKGGLARQVSKEPMRVSVQTGATTAGVAIVVGRRRGGARSANQGRVRHPVFGNRDRWVTQVVQPGWFDKSLRRKAPDVRRNLDSAVNDFVKRLERRG